MIRIWDVQKKLSIGSLEGHTNTVSRITFSPDGKFIYSSSLDKTIRCWDAFSGRPVGHPLRGHSDIIWAFAASPNGDRVVSGAYDRTIRIWNTENFHWGSDQSLASCSLLGPEKRPACIPDEGWIRTVDGGLLLYIPAEYRRAICDMHSLCISQDEGNQLMYILWDRLCHGEKWIEVGKDI